MKIPTDSQTHQTNNQQIQTNHRLHEVMMIHVLMNLSLWYDQLGVSHVVQLISQHRKEE